MTLTMDTMPLVALMTIEVTFWILFRIEHHRIASRYPRLLLRRDLRNLSSSRSSFDLLLGRHGGDDNLRNDTTHRELAFQRWRAERTHTGECSEVAIGTRRSERSILLKTRRTGWRVGGRRMVVTRTRGLIW